MSEFIRRPRFFSVPTQAGELIISPSHDILHHWRKNGAWMLKYMDQQSEGVQMKNVVLHQETAQWLIENCDLEVCERTFMSTDEFSHYTELVATQGLDHLDFEADGTMPEGD